MEDRGEWPLTYQIVGSRLVAACRQTHGDLQKFHQGYAIYWPDAPLWGIWLKAGDHWLAFQGLPERWKADLGRAGMINANVEHSDRCDRLVASIMEI